MSFAFTPENQKEFERLLTRYPNKKAALLPVLWLAQNQNGYLPLDVQQAVAEMLELTPAHVYGVVSFYTMFKDKPVGKYHLGVCRTLSCALCGAESIMDHIKNRLCIKDGQVSDDGKFSFEEMECLASCGTGPMMMVNEAYFEDLTIDKVDQLLDRLVKET